jgi:hypothetical protein
MLEIVYGSPSRTLPTSADATPSSERGAESESVRIVRGLDLPLASMPGSARIRLVPMYSHASFQIALVRVLQVFSARLSFLILKRRGRDDMCWKWGFCGSSCRCLEM